jgi:UDP-glucose 4-epimerase
VRILVTGGAGFIGSHVCVALLEAGHAIDVVDNLANSSEAALRRVQKLTGRTLRFHRADLLDAAALDAAFAEARPEAVVHLAGLKAVGESVREPLRYHRNNVGGSLNLLEAMTRRGVHRLVFSSSCTVYGAPARVPISESHPLRAINPYGRTKLIIEDMCRDLAAGDPRWKIALLRYFNPVGAHPSGEIGEDPRGVPNNLMPYVMQVAVGRLPRVRVFGNDYPTRDGTGIRDYLHVVDLAQGHLRALEGLDALAGCEAINLGTGHGHSVLEVIRAVEVASGRSVPWEFAPRRDGDSAEAWADPARARALWGWRAEHSLADMCADGWRFAQANPAGYDTA